MPHASARTSLCLALALASCHPPAPPVTPESARRSALPAVAVTLRDLQNGDRACYVVVEKADGAQASLEGDFALCAGGDHDATAMIGERITFTTRPARVLAAACEGNVDCGESDHVDLVVALETAR